MTDNKKLRLLSKTQTLNKKFVMALGKKKFHNFFVHICSPDNIDPLNISNPKANRILNCIAISAISSFLKFPH